MSDVDLTALGVSLLCTAAYGAVLLAASHHNKQLGPVQDVTPDFTDYQALFEADERRGSK